MRVAAWLLSRWTLGLRIEGCGLRVALRGLAQAKDSGVVVLRCARWCVGVARGLRGARSSREAGPVLGPDLL